MRQDLPPEYSFDEISMGRRRSLLSPAGRDAAETFPRERLLAAEGQVVGLNSEASDWLDS